MINSRSKKASLNIAVMGAYELVAFVCGLILPRFILSAFGSAYNGIISSATQFLSFISILRMGIAGSTRVSLYKALADGDNVKISGIVNATEKYMHKVGIILLVYIAVLAFIYPFISETGVNPWESALLIAIVGAGSFAQYFFGITYQTLLSADQSSYIYYLLSIGQTIVNTIISVVLILAGANIFIVRLGSAVVYVVTPVVLRYVVMHRYSLDLKVPEDKSGLKGRWDVMGHSIANIVHENTDVVVLTIFADIKIVSVYTVYYLVINGLKKVMSIFTTGLEAAFGNMFAKNEIDSVNRSLDVFEFLMCSFVSVVFSCTILLILPFVQLYTAGVTDVNYIVPVFAYLAVIAMAVQCIRQPYLTIVQAAGHYKQTRNGAFAEAIINIVLSVALTFRYGLVGVTIGTLVANTFRTLQYVLYIRRNIIFRSLKKALQTILWLVLNFIVIVILLQLVLTYFLIESWIQWILVALLCFFGATGITLLSSFIFQRKKLIDAWHYALKMMPIKRKLIKD